MRYIIPYDYAALHQHLQREWLGKPTPPSDEELVMAAQKLTTLEFEIFKFCRFAERPMKRREIADHLYSNDLSSSGSDGVIAQLCFRIRRKGFELHAAGPDSARLTERNLHIVELISKGRTYAEISERLGITQGNISVLTSKLRDRYPQFHLGNVAKTRT